MELRSALMSDFCRARSSGGKRFNVRATGVSELTEENCFPFVCDCEETA